MLEIKDKYTQKELVITFQEGELSADAVRKVDTIEKLDRDMTLQKMFVRRIEQAEVTT